MRTALICLIVVGILAVMGMGRVLISDKEEPAPAQTAVTREWRPVVEEVNARLDGNQDTNFPAGTGSAGLDERLTRLESAIGVLSAALAVLAGLFALGGWTVWRRLLRPGVALTPGMDPSVTEKKGGGDAVLDRIVGETLDQQGTLTDAERAALAQADRALAETPESRYRVRDWMVRAHAAHAAERWDEALVYFAKAADAAVGTDADRARALLDRAAILGGLDREEEALAVLDGLARRFGDCREPDVRHPVAAALLARGVLLGQMEREDEELAAYDALAVRFGNDPDARLRRQAARALINKGLVLARQGSAEAELEAYDSAATLLGGATDPLLNDVLARALFSKGVTLGRMGRIEEALAAFDAVADRFGADESPDLRQRVARALFNKAVALGQMGRDDRALETYDRLLARFGADGDPLVRGQIARSWVNKGVTLGRSGRSAESLAAYDAAIRDFGADEQVALREQVSRALLYKGAAFEEMGRLDEAREAFAQVVERCRDAADPAAAELGRIAGEALDASRIEA